MMKIRIVTILLLLAVLGTVFTGCNDKEEDNLELVWESEADKGRGFSAFLCLVSLEGGTER